MSDGGVDGGDDGGRAAGRPVDPWAGLAPEQRVPHPDRLRPTSKKYERAMRAHDRAVERGELGYLDPFTGLFVMTAVTLWRRESCCASGCRHCPYLDR